MALDEPRSGNGIAMSCSSNSKPELPSSFHDLLDGIRNALLRALPDLVPREFSAADPSGSPDLFFFHQRLHRLVAVHVRIGPWTPGARERRRSRLSDIPRPAGEATPWALLISVTSRGCDVEFLGTDGNESGASVFGTSGLVSLALEEAVEATRSRVRSEPGMDRVEG
jgi:hypothetical protein